MQDMPDIELRNVWFSYDGDAVLRDVSLIAPRNDFLAVIGPNGGGKTTFLKLILGLITPTRGTVRVFGGAPSGASLRIGYVAQNTAINPDFPIRARDVVLMGRLGHPKRMRRFTVKDHDAARWAMETMDMWEYRDRKIGSLSGGQRQRVFIARALASEPEILLLDEPTSSIDTEGQRKTYEILKRLNERITILVVSHDLTILLGYAKTVAYVNIDLFPHHAPFMSPDLLIRLAGSSRDHICPIELLSPDIGRTTDPQPGDSPP